MAQRRARIRILAIVGLLVASMLALPGAPTSAVGTCVTPPTFVPVASLNPGDMAVGWTAVSGQTPVSFDVEILGVLDDGIAPGVDFVLIEVSGPVVDAFGGIASGMSGSPVYIGADLVGAVSYGVGGDHMIGGLTPAEDMLGLLNYPEAMLPALAVEVPLSPALRTAASEATGTPVARAPSVAEQLSIPLAVSGLGKHGINHLVTRFEKRDLPFTPYAAGSAAAPPGPGVALPGTQPAAGEPVAAMLSYGDVTWGGIGTQTATCGDLSVAFGHPLGWFGRTQMGMSEASVVAVIPDPIWGPFKLANIGDAAGTIDQDRTAGIRGIADAGPALVPVTTTLDNAELGTSKVGQTDMALKMFMPDIAASHLAQAVWSSNDSWWEGTVDLQWEIQGLREDGTPFSVSHDDAYYDDYDVGWLVSNYLWYDLYILLNNDFEEISITSVDVTGDVSQGRGTAKVGKILSRTPTQPTLAERDLIVVRKGQPITVHAELDPWGPTPPTTEIFVIPAPTKPGRYMVSVSGGEDAGGGGGYYDYSYSYYDYSYYDEFGSFEDILASFEPTYANTDLVVRVVYPTDTSFGISEEVRSTSSIVEGSRLVQLTVKR